MTHDTRENEAVADGVGRDGDDAETKSAAPLSAEQGLVPAAIQPTLAGGAVHALREVARLTRPGDPDVPWLQEAPANAIGSQVTPLRLSRLGGVKLYAEKGDGRTGVVLADRVRSGRPRLSRSPRTTRWASRSARRARPRASPNPRRAPR